MIDNKKQILAETLIISAGARAKLLGLENERKYMGYGVSACATCDGFFFKDKHVFVVGGGDSAMEEAIFLTKYAASVTILHRRDEFRASKIMLACSKNPKIKFMTSTVVDDILGDGKVLTGLLLRSLKTGERFSVSADGLFIAIGHEPNTKLFAGQLELDDAGYIVTKKSTMETSVEGVFACGDVQDSRYRQAVTAAGTGCMAAIDAERFLEHINAREEKAAV